MCGKRQSRNHILAANTDGTWAADSCLRSTMVQPVGRGRRGNVY